MIDPRIFRAYDIRGRAHEQLDAEACRLIARTFGAELSIRYGIDHPTLCVGRDARTHSPEFLKAVIEGLLESGCRVIDIGETPSPVNYFTICNQELDGGIQVTASHNPGHDNGLKLSMREAEAFAGDDIQKVRQMIDDGFERGSEGRYETLDAEDAYVRKLKHLFPNGLGTLRIAVDSGNGVAGPLYCKALRELDADVTELFIEPDGTFPNHAADPSKLDTLKTLQKTVIDKGLDAGLAFDGDGDRMGFVDEKGNIRNADELLLLLARDHLLRFPGAPIIFTVSNSGILETEISKWGGKPVMCKVGHSFVEHTMREHHSKLGGEQSGHFFCGENYFDFDDALVAALRVLSILKESDIAASDLFAEFPKVFQTPEIRPKVEEEKKSDVIERVTKHFAEKYPVITLDGVRIDFGEGAWAGIRQSNTSPCISICMEARSKERLEEIENEVLRHLKTYPEITW